LLALLFAGALHALPLGCEPGKDCWVVNHVDMAAGREARDYTCGPQTYDGHDGTDIAITGARMRAGVPVLASAPGTVRGVRDGEPDGGPVTQGRECGNGVLVDHGDASQTQYCHLRSGSVRVRRGERVARGAPLGFAGMSGRAEFPHLHWAVRRKGKPLDPFTGHAAGEGCGSPGTPLWDASSAARLRYLPAAIFAAGLAGERPAPADAYDGERVPPPGPESPAFLIWVALYGVRAGDEISLTLTTPTGAQLFRRQRIVERTQARYFAFGGRKRSAERWPPGEYRGEASLRRTLADGTTFAVSRAVRQRIE